jgi:hypothetical protein
LIFLFFAQAKLALRNAKRFMGVAHTQQGSASALRKGIIPLTFINF